MTALLRDVLASWRTSVAFANSGRDAMIQIQLDTFDLVLLDVVIPDVDGWEVLRFMASAKPELLSRTILLTGDRYGRGTAERIRRCGLPVVYKPFDVDKLRAVARDILVGPRSPHAA